MVSPWINRSFKMCIRDRAGIVGVQGAGTGSSVLILGKQSFQFGVFLCPDVYKRQEHINLFISLGTTSEVIYAVID